MKKRISKKSVKNIEISVNELAGVEGHMEK